MFLVNTHTHYNVYLSWLLDRNWLLNKILIKIQLIRSVTLHLRQLSLSFVLIHYIFVYSRHTFAISTQFSRNEIGFLITNQLTLVYLVATIISFRLYVLYVPEHFCFPCSLAKSTLNTFLSAFSTRKLVHLCYI